MNPLEKQLWTIAGKFALVQLEPQPIRFTRTDEIVVPRVRAAIARAESGALARFRTAVNRNGFLCGCLDYTEAEPIEHLIVGYGDRFGSTTKIHAVHHARGNADSVRIPARVSHAMWQHCALGSNSEVIVFHNHPITWLSQRIDCPPLPSNVDRHTLERLALQPDQLLRAFRGKGRVLFYLGQNGFVRQFRLPNLESVPAVLDSIVPLPVRP
jgi:hypothetical protein